MRPRTLVLYAGYADRLSYFDDWREAFLAARELEVETLDICDRRARKTLARRRDEYDLIVLLHSTNGDWLGFLRPLAPILADRKGLLLSFVGNEVNIPGMRMSEKIRLLEEIRPDWIATQLLLEAGTWLYRHCVRREVVALPHALAPAAFPPGQRNGSRPIDVGVRSAKYGAYLGDDERNRLIARFQKNDFDPPLRLDISTRERFDREGWAAFLGRCKGTIATEAGSWYLEPDDKTVDAFREWAIRRKQTNGFVLRTDSLQKLAMLTPPGLRRFLRKHLRRGPLKLEVSLYDEVDFAEAYERFFKHTARAPVYGKCISSRHFDAIGTKTCQIMLKGRFNDLLRPGEHYLAVEPDFSNLHEVMARFLDPEARRAVVDAAYEHVLSGHTYAHRLEAVARLLGA